LVLEVDEEQWLRVESARRPFLIGKIGLEDSNCSVSELREWKTRLG